MESKKILIVTYSFYPDQSPRSFRATELTKELCRQGHHVTVVAPDRKGTSDLADKYRFNFISLGTLNWRTFEFNNFGVVGRQFNKKLNALLAIFFEFPLIGFSFKIRKALKNLNEKSYDLLISVAYPYPVHWGVALFWDKNSINNPSKIWVADCGDPYYGAENYILKKPFYWAWVEKWFMRKTDYITVPTSSSYLGYFNEFHNKIKVIPQGFKFQEYQFETSSRKHTIPTFAYAGIFISGRRDPSMFCEYLLQTGKDFRFHIYTANKSFVEKYTKFAPEKFIIHDFMPRMQLLKTLKSSVDFLVNIENTGVNQTPSKLIDYALLDKPILSVKSFEINKSNINDFLDFNYRNKFIVDDINQYRIENVTGKFIEFINNKI
jgi:hypothetical protein